jgi:short-subunit dehydrogenase
MSAYNTAKAGVLALSETMRGELAEDGVMVSVLMPTYVRTNIGVNALGPTEDKQLARLLIDRSKLTAEEVALETLQKMEIGEFYIVLPAHARFLWRFKRLMPDRFSRFISKEVNRVFIRKQSAPGEPPSDLG